MKTLEDKEFIPYSKFCAMMISATEDAAFKKFGLSKDPFKEGIQIPAQVSPITAEDIQRAADEIKEMV